MADPGAPPWTTTCPSTVARVALRPTEQMVAPVAAGAHPWPSFPASLPSPRFGAHLAAVLPLRPERNLSTGSAVFPDAIPRAALPTAAQTAAWAVFVERTTALASATFADRFPSPRSSPAAPAFTIPPDPGQWSAPPGGWYPEAIRRPAMRATDQRATAFPLLPERSFVLVAAVFPDAAGRPATRAADHQASLVLPPAPERTVLPSWATYPDRIERRLLSVAAQPAMAAAPLAPERVAPLASPVYPHAAHRPSVHPAVQMAGLSIEPLPERPRWWSATFPDRMERPALVLALQLAASSSPPAPERRAPLAATTFPEEVRGPTPRTTFPTFASPSTLDRPGPLPSATFPDAVLRPSLHAAAQETVPLLAPTQERRSFFGVFFPDAVARPGLLAAEQLAEAWAEIERSAPLPAPVYPDAFPEAHARQWMSVALMPAGVLAEPPYPFIGFLRAKVTPLGLMLLAVTPRE